MFAYVKISLFVTITQCHVYLFSEIKDYIDYFSPCFRFIWSAQIESEPWSLIFNNAWLIAMVRCQENIDQYIDID